MKTKQNKHSEVASKGITKKLQGLHTPISSYVEHMENMLLTYSLVAYKSDYSSEYEYAHLHLNMIEIATKGYACGLSEAYILYALELAFPNSTPELYKEALCEGQQNLAKMGVTFGEHRQSYIDMALYIPAVVCKESDLFKDIDFDIYD